MAIVPADIAVINFKPLLSDKISLIKEVFLVKSVNNTCSIKKNVVL